MGIQGEYIARILEETRRRPNFIVQQAYGIKVEHKTKKVKVGIIVQAILAVTCEKNSAISLLECGIFTGQNPDSEE